MESLPGYRLWWVQKQSWAWKTNMELLINSCHMMKLWTPTINIDTIWFQCFETKLLLAVPTSFWQHISFVQVLYWTIKYVTPFQTTTSTLRLDLHHWSNRPRIPKPRNRNGALVSKRSKSECPHKCTSYACCRFQIRMDGLWMFPWNGTSQLLRSQLKLSKLPKTHTDLILFRFIGGTKRIVTEFNQHKSLSI